MTRKHFATVKVMKSGRITIPSDIRELEDINEGSYLRISIEKIAGQNEDKNQIKKVSEVRNAKNEK